MAKRQIRKTAVNNKSKVHVTMVNKALSKHHRPAHVAIVGGLIALFKGIFLLVGIGLVLFGAFSYLFRAAKSDNKIKRR